MYQVFFVVVYCLPSFFPFTWSAIINRSDMRYSSFFSPVAITLGLLLQLSANAMQTFYTTLYCKQQMGEYVVSTSQTIVVHLERI
jgi:hypothetical protein